MGSTFSGLPIDSGNVIDRVMMSGFKVGVGDSNSLNSPIIFLVMLEVLGNASDGLGCAIS